jgi:REP element-mobilizing transposase RayT
VPAQIKLGNHRGLPLRTAMGNHNELLLRTWSGNHGTEEGNHGGLPLRVSRVNAMEYDPKKHHRRSIRLVDYDYAQAGAYFVTVCAEDHTCLFGDVVGSEMRLNDAGRMVQTAWDEAPGHYPGVETDAFVVMPNHIHAIVVLAPDPVGAGPCARPLGPRACANEEGQPPGGCPYEHHWATRRGRPPCLPSWSWCPP